MEMCTGSIKLMFTDGCMDYGDGSEQISHGIVRHPPVCIRTILSSMLPLSDMIISYAARDRYSYVFLVCSDRQ
jgi:hypothetical protein